MLIFCSLYWRCFVDLVFDDRTLPMLEDEVRELQESITCQINIYSITGEDSRTLLGQAIVELWVMVEDSCNILRQEIDIFTSDMTNVIGSAVVDVKGHRLLNRAADA